MNPAAFDIGTAHTTVLQQQKELDKLEANLKRKERELGSLPNRLQAAQAERDQLVQSLQPHELARIPRLENQFQIRQDLADKKQILLKGKSIKQLPINEAHKKLERLWRVNKEIQSLTLAKPQLEVSIDRIREQMTKLKIDRDELMATISKHHHDNKTQPPKALIFAGGQIVTQLQNLSIQDIESKYLALSKLLDDLINQIVPGQKQPELDEKKQELDEMLAGLKEEMERYLSLQGNLGKKIAHATKIPLEALLKNMSEFDEAIAVLKALESLAESSPTLVVAVLREIPAENKTHFFQFLFSKQALGVISPPFILKILRCALRTECQNSALAILKGNTTTVNLFRQDSVVDKLPGEFQRFCLGGLFTPCIQQIHQICQTHPFELSELALKGGNIKVEQARCTTALRTSLEVLRDAVRANKANIPPYLIEMYRSFYEELKKYCPGAERTQISALFFLRFVCPEILNPEKTAAYPPALRSSLIYLSKALQSIANNEAPTDAKMQFMNEGDPSLLKELQRPIGEIVDLLLS